jgi:magnesium-transporting ATPase (P-type)
MDTMGALALGTEPPSSDLLKRKPYKRNASLVSNKMIRNIIIQFLFQLSVLAYIIMHGENDFNVEKNTPLGAKQLTTIVFNTFVFCQIFNEINARSIGDDVNVFRGLFNNTLFIGIILFTIVSQFLIVEYGGDFVKTTHLNQMQWLKCVVLGALSLPVGGLMRLIPVKDSTSDFAEIPAFLKNQAKKLKLINNNNNANTSSKKSLDDSKSHSFSFFVWFFVASLITALAVNVFAELWIKHVQSFSN